MDTLVHNLPEVKCNSDISFTACSGLPQCEAASLVDNHPESLTTVPRRSLEIAFSGVKASLTKIVNLQLGSSILTFVSFLAEERSGVLSNIFVTWNWGGGVGFIMNVIVAFLVNLELILSAS